MGQQQLLLIVLGVIIVGISVVVGINMFSASSANSNKDALVADLSNLASMAQQYYRKPTELGGGGNKFTSWTVPAVLDTTGNGAYATSSVSATSVTITGTGNEKGANGSPVLVTATVTSTGITMAMTNP